ncbi:hypothetical protein [Candidatus Spongiihabitans sp.]|uniref:hypothetical protein n=1 Tax=Candidatus Spongiihabitans sp. TaxID=3101308 RepID=UPI003C6ED3BE
MSNRTTLNPGPLELERQNIVRQGSRQISDELKEAVELAYKLSVKEPPPVKVETLTSGSYKNP